MASIRNAVMRRTHKERSQPSDRQRLGLLEKHKDYVLRARDYHKKENTIQVLKEKAAFRNPDEFYFRMYNSKVVDGVHRSTKCGKQYSVDEILRMKTHDIKYVQRMAQAERKRMEQLTTNIHLVGQPRVNKHTYFAENSQEQKRLKAALVAKQNETKKPPSAPKKKQGAAHRGLQESIERDAKLKNMLSSMQKEVMDKGRKRKRPGNGKWVQERKK